MTRFWASVKMCHGGSSSKPTPLIVSEAHLSCSISYDRKKATLLFLNGRQSFLNPKSAL